MGIYTEAFHHFVWATRKREHFIMPEAERELYRCLRHLCEKVHTQIHALNGIPDHVHLVVTLPATLAPSVLMHDIKGASAHLINHLPQANGCLYWQEGYGWLTLTQDDLPRVIAYVDRQKERHALGKQSLKLERAADWEQRPAKPLTKTSQPREAGVSWRPRRLAVQFIAWFLIALNLCKVLSHLIIPGSCSSCLPLSRPSGPSGGGRMQG